MSWEDRIKEAAYTPPSGTRLTFHYEDVSRELDKKTTVFIYPDKNGAHVQDLGLGGMRYPLRVYFWGEDYDVDAATFLKALAESGPGTLEHPVYGRKTVVPTGTIRQEDNLKTGANQAIFEVVFYESFRDLEYPESDEIEIPEIEEFSDIAAGQFEDNLSIETSSEKVSFKDKFTDTLNRVKKAMQKVNDTSDAVKKDFERIQNGILNNLDELLGTPSRLASDTASLVRAPSQSNALIKDKIGAYRSLISDSLTRTFSASFNSSPINDFLGVELVVNSALLGLVEVTTVDPGFTTRAEAIDAAASVLDAFEEVQAWADDARVELGIIDTGETYAVVLQAVSAAAGRLIASSFSLLQERIVTLQNPTTLLNLVAEYYGELDNKIDFFITSNNLVGREILEIPAGREIRYYV